MSIFITPRGTAKTNRTNGFELDRRYEARREGNGFVVRLAGGAERFITKDGHGGAHLMHSNEKPGYLERSETAGFFEIEERSDSLLCTMCCHGTTEICQICNRCAHLCLGDKSHLYCGPRETSDTVRREKDQMRRVTKMAACEHAQRRADRENKTMAVYQVNDTFYVRPTDEAAPVPFDQLTWSCTYRPGGELSKPTASGARY